MFLQIINANQMFLFSLSLSQIFSDKKTYRNLKVAKLKGGAKLDKKEWYNAVSFERFCV